MILQTKNIKDVYAKTVLGSESLFSHISKYHFVQDALKQQKRLLALIHLFSFFHHFIFQVDKEYRHEGFALHCPDPCFFRQCLFFSL